MMRTGFFVAALALAATAQALVPAGFTDAVFVTVGAPTDVTFTPDGRMLVTSQGGTLRVYNQGATLLGSTTIPAAQICTNSERGLLGVATDPGFASNGFVYLFYTRNNGGCVNRVSRFTMTGNTFSMASEVIQIDNMPSPNGNHNAGDVGFGQDGYLYISIGEGGVSSAARNESVLTGKILRIGVNANGSTSIPATNPFQGPESERCALAGRTVTAGKTRCQETYAWGFRNPFRFAFDPNVAGTRLFINDVGQNTWEEIDLAQAGADYGWNVREGHCAAGSTTNCGAPPAGMTNPIYDYGRGMVPGTTASNCAAITGGAFVPNGVWPPAYDNTYLFADYVCGWIFRMSSSGPFAASDFATSLGGSSATSLVFGPFGGSQALYYTSYAGGGQVHRISYALPGNNPPTAVIAGAPLTGPAPLTVDFSAAGSSDPDAGNTLTYFWTFGDGTPEVVTTSVTVQHTYNAGGSYTATLRARDNNFAFSTPVTLIVQPNNTPPVPSIQSPGPAATFAVGDTITLTGSATDAEEGTIPPSRLSWRVILHHATHTHPFLGPVTGNNITFTAPAPEDLLAATNSYLEIQLTATDLSLLSATVTRDLQPKKVDVTFATVPAGLGVTVNGMSLIGPQTVTSWQNYVLNADAPLQQSMGPDLYLFLSWSLGMGNALAITTPAAPATYTATYQLSTDVGPLDFFTLPPCRVVDTRLAGGPLAAGATRNFMAWNVCNIPPTARAIAVNLAVTSPTVAGHLRLYPSDELVPGTSTLNFRGGQTRANNAVLRLGGSGAFSVLCAMGSGSTHFILDVTGYFE